MSLVVALSEIAPQQVNRPARINPNTTGGLTPGALVTTFLAASAATPDAPHAALNRYPAGVARYSAAHFHAVDQFQLIMEGKGSLGRHAVCPYCVHFSRAYTPYGPLVSERETGWAFMVMHTRYDPGGQRFPASREKLRQIPNRRPWQVTTRASFPATGSGVGLLEIPAIKDDRGLFVATLTMAPNTKTTAPDPAGGDGQYLVVVTGSLMHDDMERHAPALVFIKPDEEAFQVHAGVHGLEAIIMNFPQATRRESL